MAEKTSGRGAVVRSKRRSSPSGSDLEPQAERSPGVPVIRTADELFSRITADFAGPVLVIASAEGTGEGAKLRALLSAEPEARIRSWVVAPKESAPHSRVVQRVAPHVLAGLSNGERELFEFLSERAGRWFSSFELAQQVYRRQDAAGRQLVWKYASTLRRKLEGSGPVIRACRTRGYSCSTSRE